jgi:catechol 2,3-dioxygenase-like lactoylglutathione lyase family enzyme
MLWGMSHDAPPASLPPDLPPAPPLGAVLEAAVYAADLDAAESFYGGILGLDRIARIGRRHVFYRVGPTVLLVFNPAETTKPPSNPRLPVPPHGAEGPGHLCLSATRDEIDAWRARLEAAGHPIEADFLWPNGARSLYFRDPAGNSLEIAEPRLWREGTPDG